MSCASHLLSILESENFNPSLKIQHVCEDIAQKHQGRVQAFIYYGSSLRDINNTDKMLDFYVLVDSYRLTHKSWARRLLNVVLPPSVYYHEFLHEDGALSTCKYSIVSLNAFERRTSSSALLSVMWGRFSQPCLLLFPKSEAVKTRIQTARVNAVQHLATQIRPLFVMRPSPIDFWARALRESYRTELRPEKSNDRSREIVSRYDQRYTDFFHALYGHNGWDNPTRFARRWCSMKWLLRRIIGKPVGALRVLSNAFTFDGGLDYVMRKLEDHSGVRIDVTDHQRRHPVLWSPVLAWKYYKRGAFR